MAIGRDFNARQKIKKNRKKNNIKKTVSTNKFLSLQLTQAHIHYTRTHINLLPTISVTKWVGDSNVPKEGP